MADACLLAWGVLGAHSPWAIAATVKNRVEIWMVFICVFGLFCSGACVWTVETSWVEEG
jgi:hypothetical protein